LEPYVPLPLENRRGRRRTFLAVALIALVTAFIILAIFSAAPIYLEKDQTCVIPGAGSAGTLVCGGKALGGSPYITSVCSSGGACLPLGYTNALELKFNVTSQEHLVLEYKANATLEATLTCPCGSNAQITEQSVDTRLNVASGSYTLLLVNHNPGPVKLTWTVDLSRSELAFPSPLSNFFVLGFWQFCHRRDIC